MDAYVEAFKRKKKGFKEYDRKNEIDSKKKIKGLISKVLLSVIFFLISIIYTNLNDQNLFLYKQYVLTESLPFTKFKTWYEDLFGEVLPKDEQTKAVFNGKLVYKNIEDYYDGSKLTLDYQTLVSNIQSGIVVFVGEKENYGNTVIVQGSDGTDIWYGNLENVSVKLYDYLDKETVLGQTKDEYLYLVLKKDNAFIKYEEYQN